MRKGNWLRHLKIRISVLAHLGIAKRHGCRQMCVWNVRNLSNDRRKSGFKLKHFRQKGKVREGAAENIETRGVRACERVLVRIEKN